MCGGSCGPGVAGRSALSGPVEQAHAQGWSGAASEAASRVRLPAGRAARAAPERKESP